MNQKRSETLIKKVNVNTDFLISRLQNIIALSASTTTQENQASEMLQIESNSMMIIRLIEELLSVTRTLRENWILGQMPQIEEKSEEEDVLKGISGKIDIVLDKIVQGVKFDEEIYGDEDDEEEQIDDEEEVEEKKVEPVEKVKVEQPIPEIKIEEDQIKQEDKTPEIKQEVKSETKDEVKKQSTEPEIKKENETKVENNQSIEIKDEPIEMMNDLDMNNPLEIINVDDLNNDTGMLGLDGDLQPLTLGSDGNLGEIDFESFANMGPDNTNDIIMLD